MDLAGHGRRACADAAVAATAGRAFSGGNLERRTDRPDLRFTRGKTSGLRSSVQNLRDLELDPKLFGVDGQQEFDLDRSRA
jgi:hypothetical protein